MRHFFCCTLLLILGLVQAHAQTAPFTFTTDRQQPYVALPTTQAVNSGRAWDRSASFPLVLGFNFPFRGRSISSINVLARGVQFAGSAGWLFVYNTPFGGGLIQDANLNGGGPSASPIFYQLTGPVGDRIGKIEWVNAAIAQTSPVLPDPSHYVQFQVWLYERTGQVEIRFGPNNTTSTTFNNNRIFVKAVAENNVAVTPTGSADNPGVQVENCASPCYGAVTGVPSLGVVYTFNPTTVATAATKPLQQEFSVFPNPATEQLYLRLHTASTEPLTGRLTDARGQVVHQFALERSTTPEPQLLTTKLPKLPTGLYRLQVLSAKGVVHTQALMIQ